MKLNVKFVQYGRCVIAKILYQSSDIPIGLDDFYFCEIGGVQVALISCVFPAMEDLDNGKYSLFVKGKDSSVSNETFATEFESEVRAADYVDKVSQAIALFNRQELKEVNNTEVKITEAN